MFQRLALTALHRWGEKEGRKPLVLRGARQVGKTTLVKLFAREFDVCKVHDRIIFIKSTKKSDGFKTESGAVR